MFRNPSCELPAATCVTRVGYVAVSENQHKRLHPRRGEFWYVAVLSPDDHLATLSSWSKRGLK